jgi:hypothetical protein
VNFKELYEQAKEAGFAGEILVGSFVTEVVEVRVGRTNSGKEQLGIMHKIVEGPNAGQVVWHNVILSPENPRALAVFFRTLSRYGVPEQVFQQATGLESFVPFISGRFVLECASREWQGQPQQDIRSVKKLTDNAPPTAPSVF